MLRTSIRELAVGSVAMAIGIGWFAEHQRLNAVKGELEAARAKIESIKNEVNSETLSFMSAKMQCEQLQDWLRKHGRNVLLCDGGLDSSATVFFNTPVAGEEERKASAAAQEFAKKNGSTRAGNFQVNRIDDGFLIFSDVSNPIILSADYSVVDTVPSMRR